MTPSCPPLRATPRPAAHLSPRLKIHAMAGLLACWACLPAQAQTEESWTGRLQDPATARKEARAALVEGRRECARQPAADRAACLKLVQDEHTAAMKRLGEAPARRKP